MQSKGNLEAAKKLYLEAAKEGISNAQFNLSIIYAEAEKSEDNDQKARYWLHKAAKNFHKRSMNLVAIEFEEEGNVSQAYNLYLRAAYGGLKAAQYNLGLLHQHWFETQSEKKKENLKYAIHWFERAKQQGHEKAGVRLSELRDLEKPAP